MIFYITHHSCIMYFSFSYYLYALLRRGSCSGSLGAATSGCSFEGCTLGAEGLCLLLECCIGPQRVAICALWGLVWRLGGWRGSLVSGVCSLGRSLLVVFEGLECLFCFKSVPCVSSKNCM